MLARLTCKVCEKFSICLPIKLRLPLMLVCRNVRVKVKCTVQPCFPSVTVTVFILYICRTVIFHELDAFGWAATDAEPVNIHKGSNLRRNTQKTGLVIFNRAAPRITSDSKYGQIQGHKDDELSTWWSYSFSTVYFNLDWMVLNRLKSSNK